MTLHLTLKSRANSTTVASLLGSTKQKVAALAAQGRLPGAAKIGSRWTFDLEKLQAFGVRGPERTRQPKKKTTNQVWRLSDEATAHERVYVVGFDQYVKIGYSAARRSNRIISLQTGAPERLEIYATIKGGRRLEGFLHRHFAKWRLSGEWFRKRGTLAIWIKEGCPIPEKDAGRHTMWHRPRRSETVSY